MAQMSVAEKGKLEATIRKYECQLLAFKSALKAQGAEAYEAAQRNAKARMKEVKDLKLDDSSDDDDDALSDYGGSDNETDRKAATESTKGKAPKEQLVAGGRKQGLVAKAAFLFFSEDFQLRIKEDSCVSREDDEGPRLGRLVFKGSRQGREQDHDHDGPGQGVEEVCRALQGGR